MKTIKYYIRIYKILLIQFIKIRIHFRVDFILNIVGMFVINLVGVISFKAIFDNVNYIGGWNYYELLFVYGISQVVMSPQQFFFDHIWLLSKKVATGEFIKYCLRPINIFIYYISEAIDMKGIGQCLFGIVAAIYAGSHLTISMSFGRTIFVIILFISAIFINMSIIIFASILSFLGGNGNTFLSLIANFREYGKYPVTIFNSFFKFIFTFVVPVGYIAFYPSQVLLRQNEIGIVNYLSPIVAIIFFFGSYMCWTKCAKNYAGTGS